MRHPDVFLWVMIEDYKRGDGHHGGGGCGPEREMWGATPVFSRAATRDTTRDTPPFYDEAVKGQATRVHRPRGGAVLERGEDAAGEHFTAGAGLSIAKRGEGAVDGVVDCVRVEAWGIRVHAWPPFVSRASSFSSRWRRRARARKISARMADSDLFSTWASSRVSSSSMAESRSAWRSARARRSISRKTRASSRASSRAASAGALR